MKYQVFDATIMEIVTRYVTTQISESNGKTFPADKTNSDYDQFLVQAELTDKQVHALTSNIWYEFPAMEEG